MKTVSLGYRHSIVLTEQNELYMFGWNEYGQLGFSDTTQRNVPTKLTFFDNVPIRQVIACGYHSIVLAATGELYAFGRNDCGQLGINSRKDKTRPKKVVEIRHAEQIACGYYHTFVFEPSHYIQAGTPSSTTGGKKWLDAIFLPRGVSAASDVTNEKRK